MTRLYSLVPLTAIELTPPELVAAASRTGYDAVSLRLSPFRAGEAQHPMFDNSPMLLETEARLHDSGLDVLDIEVMLLTPERDVQDFKRVFETAMRLGARNALTLIDIADHSLAADKFAQLCELAALFGISCALEFAAWLGVGSIQAANAIVSEAAQANGAMLLDPFHLIRSGGKVGDIAAIDPTRIRYAQFCDASATTPATTAAISEEARYDRLLPGDGGLPLREFVAALPAGIPFGLEVPNRKLAVTLELDERLRRTLAAAKRVAGDLL
ncbi:sugar phosphate isomerase/epimerase family protein [Paraburkholderia fungorum]|uniref:sugar phosphate isomerase/epimerase family protein n=1 Tax=Paraburkholderia fungorum TaxID=134537 RepID=UPI0038B89F51